MERVRDRVRVGANPSNPNPKPVYAQGVYGYTVVYFGLYTDSKIYCLVTDTHESQQLAQ